VVAAVLLLEVEVAVMVLLDVEGAMMVLVEVMCAVGGAQVQGQQGTGAANASLLRVMSQWWMWMNLLERGRKGARQMCGTIIPRSSR